MSVRGCIRTLSRFAATGVMFMLLTACPAPQHTDSGQPAPNAGAASADSSQAGKTMDNAKVSTSAVQALRVALKPRMAYGDFRRISLSQGWQPIVDPQCKANLLGDTYEAMCSKDPSLCQECEELPELSTCSVDGHCRMQFRHPDSAEVLTAFSYGEVKYWNESGEESGLYLTSWEFTAAPRQ